ncbi:MAG: aminotransferase class V-fold PLP-dependent enzyme [Pseudomonadota bacterium]
MSLAFGRHAVSIPGPSVIPDRVLGAMHRAAPNIYEGKLIETTYHVLDRLKAVARTAGNVAMYISNGHGAWEAALVNTLAPGDRVLVLATGRFGKGWGKMAEALGLDVEVLDFGTTGPVDLTALSDRLSADTAGQIRAVMTVQTDTATSVRNDIAGIRAALDAAGHGALLLVDCIASLGCERFEMDAWGVDVMVAGCQKGLMVPPGAAFVFSGDKAHAARDRLDRVSPYFDWRPRHAPEIYYQLFCGTPPTHHIFGLEEALTMLLDEEGLEAAWARHACLARAVWAAVDAWGQIGEMRCNIADRAHRSTAVTAIHTAENAAGQLRTWCEAEANLTLGIGISVSDGLAAPTGDSLFRIGHMGHLNPPMLLGTLGTIDAGLKALAIPHGDGALAAATAAMVAPAARGIERAAE